ncbi:MAG TPA: FtsX-like permease family protein [Pyrinomonadaceae bacterium]|nr:FtsX-like permease family protein [Pyrinomonadaceae bacterium]
MSFLDILRLAFRNLHQAKLRAFLTTMGVIVGVAVIVTMVSFGLGLQGNMVARFGALDLFNEISVFGRSLTNLATAGLKPSNRNADGEFRRGPGQRRDKSPTRVLDDAGIAEIAKIPGVAYVQPNLTLWVYMRSNDRVRSEVAAGTSVPNAASRFKEFGAGQMISSEQADEVVVTESFLNDFEYAKPEDAIGKTVEFLTTRAKTSDATKSQDEKPRAEEPANFFGIPLDDAGDEDDENSQNVSARTFRIVGVLNTKIKEGPGQGGLAGLMPRAAVYLPLPAARAWALEHRGPGAKIALALARQSGALEEGAMEGYDSAVVRVNDPVALTAVRDRLTELGFGSFSIVDEMEQIRTVFLIIDSVLGLLGGISLLVASFGIANTMVMSILERTREIGIMKAIGAEDREIKLIFFLEAAVIGFFGGVIGVIVAWVVEALANRLAYRFILKPQGATFVDFFSLPFWLAASAILFALVVSILAALYPASRAARIDPVRALRHD